MTKRRKLGTRTLKHPSDRLAIMVAVLALVGLASATALTYKDKQISASPSSQASQCDTTKEVPIAINNFTKPDSASTDTSQQLTATMKKLNAGAPDLLRCSNICLPVDAETAKKANADVAAWIKGSRAQIGTLLSGWTVSGNPMNVISNYTDINSISSASVMAQSVVLEAVKPLCQGNSSQEYTALNKPDKTTPTEFAQNNGYEEYQKQVAKDKAAADAAAAAKAAAAKLPSTAAPATTNLNAPTAKSTDSSTNADTMTINMKGKIFENNKELAIAEKSTGHGTPNMGIIVSLGKEYVTGNHASTIPCTFAKTDEKGVYWLQLVMPKTFFDDWFAADGRLYFYEFSPYNFKAEIGADRSSIVQILDLHKPPSSAGWRKTKDSYEIKFDKDVLMGPVGTPQGEIAPTMNFSINDITTEFAKYTNMNNWDQCTTVATPAQESTATPVSAQVSGGGVDQAAPENEASVQSKEVTFNVSGNLNFDGKNFVDVTGGTGNTDVCIGIGDRTGCLKHFRLSSLSTKGIQQTFQTRFTATVDNFLSSSEKHYIWIFAESDGGPVHRYKNTYKIVSYNIQKPDGETISQMTYSPSSPNATIGAFFGTVNMANLYTDTFKSYFRAQSGLERCSASSLN